MFRWITRMPFAVLMAIVLHLLLALAILLSIEWHAFSPAMEASKVPSEPTIQAQSVSQAAIEQQVKRLKNQDAERAQAVKSQELAAEQAKAAAEQAAAARRAEQARLQQLEAMREMKQKAAAAQEQQLKALQEAQKQAQQTVDNQKKALEKIQQEAAQAAAEKQAAAAAAAKEKAAADAAKKAAAQAAAEAEQMRQQAAADKAAKEKAQKEAAAKAAKEKAQKEAAAKAAKAKAEKEAAAKAAKEKAQAEKAAAAKAQQAREAALQQQLQNELRQSQSKGVLDAYGAAIKAKVTAQWFKPPGWQPQWKCNVRISQAQDGTVLNVKILQCDGDQLFQRSVQQAIERASPLPLPSDMSLFSPSINFTFKADTQP